MIPCFYDRDEGGIPRAWVARMRKSMAELTPRFSSNRMVREYVDRFYLPTGRNYKTRKANHMEKAAEIHGWQESLKKNWNRLRFGALEVQERENAYSYTLSIPVHRPGGDYTPRIIPLQEEAAVPIEEHHILWYR